MIDPQVAPRQQRLLSLYVTGNLLLVRNRLWSTREFWDPGHGVTAPSDRGRPAASSHRRVTARATHPRSRGPRVRLPGVGGAPDEPASLQLVAGQALPGHRDRLDPDPQIHAHRLLDRGHHRAAA